MLLALAATWLPFGCSVVTLLTAVHGVQCKELVEWLREDDDDDEDEEDEDEDE